MFSSGKSSLGETVNLAAIGIMDRLWKFREKIGRKV